MEVEIFVKCEQCHFRFRLKTKLRKHMKHRKVNIVVKCKQCHFRSRQNVTTHIRHNNKIFQKRPQVLEEGRKSCKM